MKDTKNPTVINTVLDAKPAEVDEKEEILKEAIQKEAKVETKKEYTVISEGRLNVREQPSATAKVVSTIPSGSKVTVIESVTGISPDWKKIDAPAAGFVASKFVASR